MKNTRGDLSLGRECRVNSNQVVVAGKITGEPTKKMGGGRLREERDWRREKWGTESKAFFRLKKTEQTDL